MAGGATRAAGGCAARHGRPLTPPIPARFPPEIIGAGCTLVTHNNCILAYGGLDGERAEQAHLWRWDLAGESGFEPVAYRGAIPPRLTAGHVAAVHGDELWVFPGPRNADLRTVHVLDLLR